MNTLISLALAAACLPASATSQSATRIEAPAQLDAALPVGRDWIVKSADNICGLSDAHQLTLPAKIDFDRCLAATREMKKIKQQGIDPRSAEGIQLRSAAITRVTRAAEAVRSAGSYCSVWKQVRHKDGRAIADISSRVIAKF